MPTKVKGCFNCSRRRINCDRNEPQCLKCLRADLECSGLGVRYRWISCTDNHQGTIKKKSNTKEPQPSSASHPTGVEIPTATSPSYSFQTSPTSFDSEFLMLDSSLSLSPVLSPHTHSDLWAVKYFAEEISQWLYPFLKPDNEYNTLLLPFALTSTEVFNSIAAISFHRLAYYGNVEFASKAEQYKTSAIKGLMNASNLLHSGPDSEYHTLTAIAVVIALVYDDMVAAQDYYPFLIPIMKNLRSLDVSEFKNKRLATFLVEQLGILLVLCLPYAAQIGDDKDLQDHAFHFIGKFTSTTTGQHPNASFLSFCLHQTATIWLQKSHSPESNVDAILENMKARIEMLPDLGSVDHYLSWVYFMAAASAAKDELRMFFATQLSGHLRTFGWRNISLMLGFLDDLWSAGNTWPAHLRFHKEYLCA